MAKQPGHVDVGVTGGAAEALSAAASALHSACLSDEHWGHAQVVELLDADLTLVDSTTASGATALHAACHGGDRRVVGLLLARNADVNALDHSGRSPLTVACGRMYGDVVQRLLRSGADALRPGARVDAWPLYVAAVNYRWGHTDAEEIVNMLLLCGAPADGGLDEQGREHDHAPLHGAAASGNVGAARQLLGEDGRADVDRRTHGGGDRTALHVASSHMQVSMVQLLLASGANVRAETSDGHSALREACAPTHPMADFWATSRRCDIRAARAGVVRALLDAGAGVDRADRHGRTPLYASLWSTHGGGMHVAQLLLVGGADANRGDRDGRTPLSEALSGWRVHEHARAVHLCLVGRRMDALPRDVWNSHVMPFFDMAE